MDHLKVIHTLISIKYLEWLSGRVVMQRTATPCTSVRFRSQPPYMLNNHIIKKRTLSYE